MIYEFIATITAGFGMAGLALIIRHLTKLLGKSTPKWLIPICAGLGMLAFQIHQEYHWHEQKMNRLPDTLTVVKVVNGQVWYRPWSYIKPQVMRFMAVSQGVDIFNEDRSSLDNIQLIDIYLFERRMSTKIIRQQINCTKATYMVIGQASDISEPITTNKNSTWYPIETNDVLFKTICLQVNHLVSERRMNDSTNFIKESI